jgi:hypothetical protein
VKAYLIDEISPSDMRKTEAFLNERTTASSLGGLFWVELPARFLTHTQSDHGGCRPHVFAVELGHDWIKFEFLIRSLNKMRCTCTGSCTDLQREHIMRFAEQMLEELDIRT